MTREEAIKDLQENGIDLGAGDFVSVEALRMAVVALREQEERSKACPYCDVAKANEGVKNTVLWMTKPETKKWTMMGKKLLFCPMCGRRLEEV